jgi:peptidoglycan/LPS O-acetylase OafA/YrhL
VTAPTSNQSDVARPVGARRSSRYLPEVEALRGIAIAHRRLRLAWPDTFVGWNATTVAALAALALLCAALSALSYTVIERPFLVGKARIDG